MRIAVANAEPAPYGTAAREALTNAGVWQQVKPRLVYGENVRQTLQLAETGNAEVALVALALVATDTVNPRLLIEETRRAPLNQALVVCRHGASQPGDRAFLNLVKSTVGSSVMRRYGFELPGPRIRESLAASTRAHDMSERQIEMLWRCTSCGHKNLGRYGECQNCSNPKDGSEEWEMPGDTSAAPSVTDPELLKLAKAGADWRCAFCGSDQRALDGTCRSCGAKQGDGTSLDRLPPKPLPRTPVPVPVKTGCSIFMTLALVMGGLVALCLGGGVFVATRSPFDDVNATVSAVSWEHRVLVDRWQTMPGEGFAEARPADAFDVKPAGRRVHHEEQVFDHNETEHYTEQVSDGYRTEHYSEEVSDGTRSESYTERVRCGEDCTESPEICSEECTSNKNGFATCRTVCSGGGRSCSPRYCDETRTRQVPTYRTVDRTRKVPKYRGVDRTRQVPVYRSEPRSAPYYTWKTWQWVPNRVVRASGTTTETSWPSEVEVNAGARLGPGEKERVAQAATYSVTFTTHSLFGGSKQFTSAPQSLDQFIACAPGSSHRLRVRDAELLSVDPAP
ncbi:MAG: molybdate ABC transporter substrate-binding protein [Myxococcales bacterium]|nr:molybdate ABC transporter substrate-binding protein [Myxococcales bacterium]